MRDKNAAGRDVVIKVRFATCTAADCGQQPPFDENGRRLARRAPNAGVDGRAHVTATDSAMIAIQNVTSATNRWRAKLCVFVVVVVPIVVGENLLALFLRSCGSCLAIPVRPSEVARYISVTF